MTLVTADGKNVELKPDASGIVATIKTDEYIYTVKLTRSGRLVMN